MSCINLFANPYDLNARGFYFSNSEELRAKLRAQPLVEEYELEFIDGSEAALTFFNAMKPSLATIDRFFETLLANADVDQKLALISYALENGICNTLDDAEEYSENTSTFEGTIEEYAAEYFDSVVDTKAVPEMFIRYFDHEAFARDLELGGEISEFQFCDKTFVVLNV